jgi:hypothetical protein
MKFGIVQYLGGGSVTSPELFPYHILQQAKWAERYGFESVLIGEHHALSKYMPDPFIVATYLAAHTNKSSSVGKTSRIAISSANLTGWYNAANAI